MPKQSVKQTGGRCLAVALTGLLLLGGGASEALADFTASVTTNIDFAALYADPAGGLVDLSSGGTISGSGQIGSSGTTAVGLVEVDRTSSVRVEAYDVPSSMTMTCGTESVDFTPTVDDSACSTASTGSCDIYVTGYLTLSAGSLNGSCTTGSMTFSLRTF